MMNNSLIHEHDQKPRFQTATAGAELEPVSPLQILSVRMCVNLT